MCLVCVYAACSHLATAESYHLARHVRLPPCHLPRTESFSPGPEPSSQGRPASAIRPQTTPAEQIASGTFGRSSSWTYSLLQLKRSRTSSRTMQNERQLWCRPPKSRHVDARTYALQPMWSDHPGRVRRALFNQPPDARPLSRHSNPVIVPLACPQVASDLRTQMLPISPAGALTTTPTTTHPTAACASVKRGFAPNVVHVTLLRIELNEKYDAPGPSNPKLGRRELTADLVGAFQLHDRMHVLEHRPRPESAGR